MNKLATNKYLFSPIPKDYSSIPSVLSTYGDNDLAEKPAFQGGYINFGYWKDIWPKKIILTQRERIMASKSLYDLVISYLELRQSDQVLEVGCGRGNGCVEIAKNIKPHFIRGIDITPEQIDRANTIHKIFLEENLFLKFQIGSSEYIPFANQSFTKIYSVEASQCFPSMLNFAREAWRVLKKDGTLVITSPFSTGERGYQALLDLIPTIKQGVDRLLPIDEIRECFYHIGFKEVNLLLIGKHVFSGFNEWRKNVIDVKWAENYFFSYEKGYIEYYLLKLQK